MRRARKYTKRIELWNSAPVEDGFGGYTVTDFKLLDVWAKLSTLNKFKYKNVDFGDIDLSNSIEITIRYRTDLTLDYKNMFIVYRGYKYTFSDRSINTNFLNNEITFLATKQNDVIFGGGTLDIYSRFAKSVLGETGGVLQSAECTQNAIRNIL